MSDAARAFVVTWLILSAAGAAAVVAPLVLSTASMTTMFPACEWQVRYGVDCPWCGMTRAFIALSTGNWAAARSFNRGAPALYVLLAINALAAAAIALRSATRHRSRFTPLKEIA